MWGFSAISRFLRTEDGTATVEFVIVFPIIIIIFVAAFETAMLLTRQVIMERSLDSAVRHLRLTSGLSVTHDAIRENICENSPVLLNCNEALLLDLRVIDQETYNLPDYHTLCVDRSGVVNHCTAWSMRCASKSSKHFHLKSCAQQSCGWLNFSGSSFCSN